MEQDIDQIMNRIRDEVRRRKGASHTEGAGTQPQLFLGDATIQVPHRSVQELIPETRLSNPSAHDLLHLRDTDFVHNAYRSILKREADSPGLAEYVRRLRECTLTKEDVLQSLALSDEGRTKKAVVPGLQSVIRKNRIRHLLKDKIPVVRSLVRWVIPILKLSKVVRRLDSLEGIVEARVAEQRVLVEAAFSRHIEDLNSALQARSVQVLSLREAIVDLERRNSALEKNAEERHQNFLALNHIVVVDHEKRLSSQREGLAAQERAAELRHTELQGLHEKSVQGIDDLQSQASDLAARVAEYRSDFLSLNHIVQVELRQELETAFNMSGQKIDELQGEFLSLNHIVVVGHSERLNGAESTLTRLERLMLNYRTSLLDQERRLAILLQEARKRMPAPLDQKQLSSMVSEESHLLDAMYVAFEDRFRGTRDDIKQRVGVYVDRIQKAGLGTAARPVFDVGCGRGEWLEVLGEHGLVARGIDSNRVMISVCKERGLDVEEKDVLEALRALPTASVGVVSGFHIIEHLPLPVMIALFDEALRVLAPGGFVLFETPNPENLITAACNFYYDPTHRNPLPPPLVEFLAEARGFTRVEIVRLHRMEYYQSLDSPTATKIGELLQAAQDFSVIGYKA